MPVSSVTALANLPQALRKPLLVEYTLIVQNFLERRWGPSELSGGRFSEIVYTILNGYGSGEYASAPIKPRNFVDACRHLEQRTGVPRSFQILIPRILPALYEIRNNRNVGHVGGDVDPNYMDASAVVAMSSWVMAELVRVYHDLTVDQGQQVVDSLVEKRLPLVWQAGKIKRVLDAGLPQKDQILLMLEYTSGTTSIDDLCLWIEPKSKGLLLRSLRRFHSERMVELQEEDELIQILPPGSVYVENLIRRLI